MLGRNLVVSLTALLWIVSSAAGQTRNIMLTGYWPPTNEMVRGFSTDPVKNPMGWQGGNWQGLGYDIHSFFPEFNNFPSDRQGTGDFEVDYQDTSADWWRITDMVKPVAIVTFSRTDAVPTTWEVEWRQRNLFGWVDDYSAPFQPTPAPPDSSVPAGHIRYSSLPMENIAAAVQENGIRATIDRQSFGGGFLSEFIAYHGTWYHDLHADAGDPFRNVAAGHIHVGGSLTAEQTSVAVDATLRQVVAHVDRVLGFRHAFVGNIAIPEPSSLWLVLLGSSFLLLARERHLAFRR
jgi:hypothetical protein